MIRVNAPLLCPTSSSRVSEDLTLVCRTCFAPPHTTPQRYSSGSTRPRSGARMAVCRGRHVFSRLLSLPRSLDLCTMYSLRNVCFGRCAAR